MKISHLGLIDKESLKDAIEQRNFVGDSKRVEKNVQFRRSSRSSPENDNRMAEQRTEQNGRNVSSMSNQEIHNLLQEEVDRIKANKTKSEVPEEKNQNPEPYSKEISYKGSL